MRRKTAFSIIAVLAASGCSNFTEYSELPSAGLYVLDSSNLEILGTIPGVEGARAVCAAGEGGVFFVSSSTGELHRFDAVTMTRDTSFVIGPGASSGYGSMAYVEWKNSIYAVGALGNIIEVNAATGALRDDITAVPSPALITPSRNGQHIYVSSPLQKRVYGLSTQSNVIHWNWVYDLTPTVTGMNTGFPDTLLVATTDAAGKAYMQPCSNSPGRRGFLPQSSDIEGSELWGYMFAAHPRYSSSFGTVSVIDSLFPALSILRTITVPGNPVCLEISLDQMNLFILAATQSGNCRLYSYGMNQFSLEKSVDLPGAPAGMILAGDRLVVMSY